MRTADRRRYAKAVAIGALAASAMLALTGCLDVKSNLTVTSEGKASGDISLALQKQAASFMGITDKASFESGLTSDMTGGSDVFSAGQCVTSETDAAYVYTCSFNDTAFTASDDPWTIALKDDTIVFHLKSDASNQASAAGSTDLLGGASLGSMTVNVTFPGAIISTTGTGVKQTGDNAATVSGPLTDAFDVTITSETGSGGGIAALIAVLVGVAILVLVVIVAVLLIARRRRPDALASESAFAAPAPGIEEAVAAEAAAEAGTVEAGTVEAGTVEAGPADEQPPADA